MKRLLTLMLLAVLPDFGHANICDRTPQVRDAILRVLFQNKCASVTTEQLANIRVQELCLEGSCIEERLGHARLTSLKAGDFDGLANMQTLWLSENQLASLPDGIFDGLTRLKFLTLRDNRLTALPLGVFNGLASLLDLSLGQNQLVSLREGLFDGPTRLEGPHLFNNHLVGLTRND